MSAPRVLRIVLDTNVLLDLWLFDEPTLRPLRMAIESGRVRALRSAQCEAEFADVLARDRFGLDRAGRERRLSQWRDCSEPIEDAAPAPLRCIDPDDQKFLDATFGACADGLLTRDKALLQLSRRAAAAGVSICTPHAAMKQGGLLDRRA